MAEKLSTAKNRGRVSLAIGAVAVMLCLAAGVWFVLWSISGLGDNGTIKLSSSDLEQMQVAGGRMQFQNNGGAIQVVPMPGPFGGPGADSISFLGSSIATIRTGRVLVLVNAMTKPPTLMFRQRMWGELPNPGIFVIARRSVREKSIAQQLNVTADQMTKLTPLVNTPQVEGKYVSALPMAPQELLEAQKAWSDFAAGLPGSKAHPQALYQAMRRLGEAGLARAQRNCANTAKAITAIFTPQQIRAYEQGRSLAAK